MYIKTQTCLLLLNANYQILYKTVEYNFNKRLKNLCWAETDYYQWNCARNDQNGYLKMNIIIKFAKLKWYLIAIHNY